MDTPTTGTEPPRPRPEPPDASGLGGVLPGTRYSLETLLGEGGAGEVYRGTHLELDKAVAVKVLRNELSRDADYAARFRREARSASRIDHPGVVKVTDFGAAADGRLFLVMELIEGRTLGEVIEEGPLEPARALRIVGRLCDVLAAVHDAGIVHRDVKPGNVFLLEGDEVKLVDFGIARGGLLGAADWRITRTGRVCGTPGYMAPEHARNKELDGRADVYSAGAVLYELLTGVPPYRGDSAVDVLMAQMTAPLVPPSKARPGGGVARAIDRVVARMLSRRVDERSESARVIADELCALADEVDPSGRPAGPSPGDRGRGTLRASPPPPSPVPVSTVPATSERKASRRWLGLALSAVVLAVVAGAFAGVAANRPGPAVQAADSPPVPAQLSEPESPGPVEGRSPPRAVEQSSIVEAVAEPDPPEPDLPEPDLPEPGPSAAAAARPAPSAERTRPAASEGPPPPAPPPAPRAEGPSPREVLRQAQLAAVAGRSAEAERLYREAIAKGADRATALAGLGALLLARGEATEAVLALQRAVAIRPGSPQLRVELGRGLLAAGRRSDAIVQWRTALRLDPSNARAADLLRRQGVEP